jgi:MFS family permease
MERNQRRYLYITVFTSGMAVLGLELSASRLLGQSFGTGNIVWASVIGLTLTYLTVGYFLGGWLADRSPHPRTLYSVICWGALSGGLIPFVAMPLLPLVEQLVAGSPQAVLFGSVLTMLLLLGLPVTLLGAVSPFAIRLAIRTPEEAGRISGTLYGVSTIGSIIGSFLPSLFLIPAVGTNLTILFFGFMLLVMGLGGLALAQGQRSLRLAWMPLLLAALGIAFL